MLCSNVCCMSQLLSDTATRNIIIQSHACVQLIDLVKSKIGEYADYSLSVYLTLFPRFCYITTFIVSKPCAVTPPNYIISPNVLIN